MSIHDLKILPEHFGALIAGKKPYELRKDDRGYKVRDWLALHEWTPERGYTGRHAVAKVTYILSDERYLLPGYVCMSLSNLTFSC